MTAGHHTAHTAVRGRSCNMCANDKGDLQYMTKKLIKDCEQCVIKINIRKLKYLPIGEGGTDIGS